MKVFQTLILMVMLFNAPAVFAEINRADKIELTRAYIATNRKAIIADVMRLTEEESKGFWEVYNEYRENINVTNNRLVELIEDYGDHFENLSDDKASDLLIRYLNIEEERIQSMKMYIDAFKEVLPPKKVMRFFQMENKLNIVVKYDLAAQIPLAGDYEYVQQLESE